MAKNEKVVFYFKLNDVQKQTRTVLFYVQLIIIILLPCLRSWLPYEVTPTPIPAFENIATLVLDSVDLTTPTLFPALKKISFQNLMTTTQTQDVSSAESDCLP